MFKKTEHQKAAISGVLSPIDVANTVLQEAYRDKLLITQKQLFAAVMEIFDARPEQLGAEPIVVDHFRGRAPCALRNKFATVPLGPVRRYIPDAAGQSRVITQLKPEARRALGLPA